MAIHSLAYRIFTFFLSMVVCAGFIGVGSIIAFWPATYIRWLRWSNVHRYAPWVIRGLDLSQNQYGWQFRVPGILGALFGVITTVLTVWISWFQ